MGFLSNLLLLIFIELISYNLSIILDCYSKIKKYKTTKKPFLIFKSKFNSEKNVSLFSFGFQIVNYLFVIGWLTLAIFEIAINKSYWLSSVCRYILWGYGGLIVVTHIIVQFLIPGEYWGKC